MTAYRSIRRGITLIEMMVAMALALGIMLILTESFKMALDFVRGAHSTGELISQLNGAGLLLSRDLQAHQFVDASGNPAKLSNQRLDAYPNPPWTAPPGGFFRISAPDPGLEPSLLPTGLDRHGFKVNAPATNHQLQFTVVMPAAGDANNFTQNAGGTTYSSRSAEVAYFLSPMTKSTSVQTGPTGGLPLYNLIRRQRLVAMTTDEQTSLNPVATAAFSDVISQQVSPPSPTTVNTLATVMTSANRLLTSGAYPNALAPAPVGSPRYGEDIVVSNVLSFEIQADWTPNTTTPYTTVAPRPFSSNTDAPYDFLPGTFDTAAPTNGNYLRVKSLQITIRVYDPRVKTTRQNTWKFAM